MISKNNLTKPAVYKAQGRVSWLRQKASLKQDKKLKKNKAGPKGQVRGCDCTGVLLNKNQARKLVTTLNFS